MNAGLLPKTRSFRSDLNSNKENINTGAMQMMKNKESEKYLKDVNNKGTLHPQIPNSSRQISNKPELTLEELKAANPQYVTTYSREILEYLLKKEHDSRRENYFSKQRHVNEKMREILVDWLVDVSVKFRLLSATLFMSVNLIDRFLQVEEIFRDRFQLLGITSLFIASKYEEIYPPHMKEYISVCDRVTYTKQDMLDMEAKVILALEFNLTDSTVLRLLERFGRVAGLESKAFMFARFLTELALVDCIFLNVPNSMIAASAVYLSNKVFKREEWSVNLKRDTMLSIGEVRPTAKELYTLLHKTDNATLTAVRRKFSSKSYLEISKYRIEFKG